MCVHCVLFSNPCILSSSIATHPPLTEALKSFESGPLSPHYEAKQKVRENLWEMYFTDNGR